MQLSRQQLDPIRHLPPAQRGNVKLDNLQALNGILFVAVNDCTWRALPKRYGKWRTVYTRMNRWAKAGVLDRAFEELQALNFLRVKTEVLALDSTSLKVHPDGAGALKRGPPSHRPQPRRPCQHRNDIERLPGRIQRLRRVFTRYDNTDLVLSAFTTITPIANTHR